MPVRFCVCKHLALQSNVSRNNEARKEKIASHINKIYCHSFSHVVPIFVTLFLALSFFSIRISYGQLYVKKIIETQRHTSLNTNSKSKKLIEYVKISFWFEMKKRNNKLVANLILTRPQLNRCCFSQRRCSLRIGPVVFCLTFIEIIAKRGTTINADNAFACLNAFTYLMGISDLTLKSAWTIKKNPKEFHLSLPLTLNNATGLLCPLICAWCCIFQVPFFSGFLIVLSFLLLYKKKTS